VKVREREQLARELHDTVAHHVSAIAVQAQAGRAGAAASPQAALDALAVIEREASRTLAEMRAMVGALRYTGADLAPQRGVADLHELALRVPQRLDVEIDDHLGALSPAVDSAIYRIAQEAVTNAGRHARGATRITVRVASSPTHVTLTVADDGAGGAYDPTMSRGFGLLGMAERAHLLGGSFSAGPSTPRGWAVVAELPRSGVGP
jgi:signal transduction histidine kinase